ncbi:MAG: alpha/beta hydrolase [Patescibacteria group bacterium]|nr:alpha/beta hydrolase [Patescibacteria group bacterium]
MNVKFSLLFLRFVYTAIICLFSLTAVVNAQTQVIPLYDGIAPGSENWTQKEVEYRNDWDHKRMVRNITQPTLTAFLPDPAKANGTAVIICPGGAFRFLSWESEGTEVAEWLKERGVAAFVLKYRLINTGATEEEFAKSMQEVRELMKKISAPGKPEESTSRPVESGDRKQVIPLAVEDGKQAIRVVRRHAAGWNLAPDRIGIMGFSAGGMVTMGVVMNYDAESRPNFAASVYGGGTNGIKIPDNAPPLFILAAHDDQMGSVGSARLYSEWKTAGYSAELHIYSKGGHGFGMNKRGLPVDTWIDRFADWLKAQEFLK